MHPVLSFSHHRGATLPLQEERGSQMPTSGNHNTGIFHAVIKFGMATLCKRRNAIMATEIAKFRELPAEYQCKRCAAKLATMDASKAVLNAERVRLAPCGA